MVEDDARIKEALRIFFEAEGSSFAAVSSAENALEELLGQPYDLILSDYKLPVAGCRGTWWSTEPFRKRG